MYRCHLLNITPHLQQYQLHLNKTKAWFNGVFYVYMFHYEQKKVLILIIFTQKVYNREKPYFQ